MGAIESKKLFAHISVLTGDIRLWSEDVFVGKAGSVFTSSNNRHGGQKPTILTFHVLFFILEWLFSGFLILKSGRL